MKKRRVLILNTSHNDLSMIFALRDTNQYVIAIGNKPRLVGQKYVDEYICMDYSDKEKVLQLARDKKIDAICACCNDFGVYTAAYVAEKLGLHGHDTYENTCKINHKDEFRKLAESLDLLIPSAASFDNAVDAENYIKSLSEKSYPVMVKAVDLSAGNGITCVNSIDEAKKAINLSFEKSRIGKIVIEQYIEGSQHAICTFIKNQKVIAMTSNNEYSIVNPYRIEIDTWPADHFDDVKDILIYDIEKIAGHLKLCDGIFHMQYRINIVDGKPYIIEPMRRSIGNMHWLPAYQVSGFNWDYWEARTHIGLDISDIPRAMENHGCAAYRSVLASENGVFDHIDISDEVMQYCIGEYMLLKSGEKIDNYLSQMIGLYFFKFENSEQMKHVMIDKYNDIMAVMR